MHNGSVFPPPQPWKQLRPADPEREYVAFTSHFPVKSWQHVLPFFLWSLRIGKQANAAPGAMGWSLGANLATKDFFTLSAWEDGASLHAFVQSGEHAAAMKRFEGIMRQRSLLLRYAVVGRDLPLTWDDALARQREALRRD